MADKARGLNRGLTEEKKEEIKEELRRVTEKLRNDLSKNEDPAETVDNARILVADDHALSRSIAEKMLTRAGYTVVCAEDGKDAVEKFIAADGGFSLQRL